MKSSSIESPKVALIVGASRGIGQALSEHFQKRAYYCINAARSFENQKINVNSSQGASSNINLDVTSLSSVEKLFREIEEHKITLDSVVFSAGVGHFAPIEELSQEQWKECLEVNLTGAFTLLSAAYKHFLRHKKTGRIFVIGSVADHIALKENAAYAASKYGLRGLVSVMHEEGRAHGISTCLLSLGATYTDIWKSRPEFSKDDMLSTDDVAETICSLASLPAKVTIPQIILTPPKGIL